MVCFGSPRSSPCQWCAVLAGSRFRVARLPRRHIHSFVCSMCRLFMHVAAMFFSFWPTCDIWIAQLSSDCIPLAMYAFSFTVVIAMPNYLVTGPFVHTHGAIVCHVSPTGSTLSQSCLLCVTTCVSCTLFCCFGHLARDYPFCAHVQLFFRYCEVVWSLWTHMRSSATLTFHSSSRYAQWCLIASTVVAFLASASLCLLALSLFSVLVFSSRFCSLGIECNFLF